MSGTRLLYQYLLDTFLSKLGVEQVIVQLEFRAVRTSKSQIHQSIPWSKKMKNEIVINYDIEVKLTCQCISFLLVEPALAITA